MLIHDADMGVVRGVGDILGSNAVKYLTKSNGVVGFEYAGFDDFDDVVAELARNGDDFISCLEFEPAEVGGGGVYFDVTHKACDAFLDKYGDKVEIAWDGELQVPKIVKDKCADRVAEIEGEALDWEAEVRAMNRDYYNSLGVSFTR